MRRQPRYALQLFNRDAATFVAHAQQHLTVYERGVQPDGAAGERRELDGIGQQIDQHLQQSVRIAWNDCVDGRHLDRDASAVRRAPHRLNRVDHQFAHVTAESLGSSRADVACFDAFEIQQVVDQADQSIRVVDADVEHPQTLLVHLTQVAAGEQAECAADGGERGAQLVADDCDQIVLYARGGAAAR